MKGSVATLAALLLLLPATASAQLTGASASGAPVQFDGEAVFVDVACANEEAGCTGSVSVALVDAPTVAVGGPAPFAVDAETGQRIRVPVSAASLPALEAARQIVVLVEGAAPAVRSLVRINSESGIGPGQTEVSPVARWRSCRSFRPMSQIRVRGVECADARKLIRAAPRGCGRRCTVRRFRCSAKRQGKSVLRYVCSQETLRVQWRRSLG